MLLSLSLPWPLTFLNICVESFLQFFEHTVNKIIEKGANSQPQTMRSVPNRIQHLRDFSRVMPWRARIPPDGMNLTITMIGMIDYHTRKTQGT